MSELILRSDIAAAVEVTSWASELVKAAVAAAVDHLEPVDCDAITREAFGLWLLELYEVITDVRGLTSFAAYVQSVPSVHDELALRH